MQIQAIMKKLLILSFIFFQVLFSFAQNNEDIIISGKVIDASNKKGISFASVWIEGSFIGVSTNVDGSFVVNIPNKYKDANLSFTSVGFSSYKLSIHNTMNAENLEISLDPKLITFNEVNVSGKSLVLQRILRTVSEKIKENYIQNPFSYESYYKSEIFDNDSLQKTNEAIVSIYDKDAYNRSSVLNTFKSINYKFTEARRSSESLSIGDASTILDDVLSFDIVRNSRNVLDVRNVSKYDLKKEGEMVFEGDSIVVISYSANSTDLPITGQVGVKSYSGKIYVNKSNYAVIKNELTINASSLNELGKSIISESRVAKDFEVNILTSYSKIKDYYYLRGVSYDVKQGSKLIKTQLIPLKIKLTNPDVVVGRDYYEDKKFNEDFWSRFSVLFEGEE